MHLQPVFTKHGLFKGERCPVSENLAEKGFYIPSGLAITDDQMEQVVDNIKKVFL
jgi:perosamine synthetase